MDQMITSFRNPIVKRIKRLRQRKHRRREQAFFVEGPRLFLSAAESNAVIEQVVCCHELLTSQRCYTAIARLGSEGVPVAYLAAEVFRAVTEAEHPAGIGAILRQPTQTLFESVESKLFVALDNVADPGNLGTILRTLDACGGDGLILSGSCTDPYHPTSVKASMGAILTIPIAHITNASQMLIWARKVGLWVVATTAHSSRPFWDMVARKKTQQGVLLLMGSERHGLQPETMEAADELVSIPMQGSVTSLNLAVATALLLYDLGRPASRYPA
jgi:TrmH family RNA methyltransferase